MTTRHLRKGKAIITIVRDDTGEVTGTSEGFKSINKAKKESHAMQMKSDGALGRGSLSLI